MNLTYRIPEGVEAGKIADRSFLSTPQGGKVVVDSILTSLWQQADGKEITTIVREYQDQADVGIIRAALACLAEGGFLSRSLETEISDHALPEQGAMVSAIIVNYNSLTWLNDCIASITNQNYSPIEIVLVDNGSTEDIRPWLATQGNTVQSILLKNGNSLAYAINQGIAQASGDYYLVLNPDIKLEPDAVANLVEVASLNSNCAAVAAKLKFWWAPSFLNGLGNSVSPFGWGVDLGLGLLDLGQFNSWQEVPSACFACALIPRMAFEIIGPLDEGFPMYYEDSEWSYRARMYGFAVKAAPHAVAYHAMGMRVQSEDQADLSAAKLQHVVYGRLRFATRLAAPQMFVKFIISYLLQDVLLLFIAAFLVQWFKIGAILKGWQIYFQRLPALLKTRRLLQNRRVRSDTVLFSPVLEIPPPNVWHGLPELTWDLVKQYYLPVILSGKTKTMPEFIRDSRPRLLIVCNDIVDVKMAGPGMRYLEIARALALDLDVTLAVPSSSTIEVPGLRLVSYQWESSKSLEDLTREKDIVLISSMILDKFPFLQQTDQRIIADLYDPLVLENLHIYQNEPLAQQDILSLQAVESMNRLIRRGDYFICGNQRQLDFWMGVLASNGRLDPRSFAADPSLSQLISIVGVGFPDRRPQGKPILRGVHPAFPPQVKIALWGGGIWDWLDPLSLVQAWPQVIQQQPDARLVFLGTRHPNPLVPPHRMAERTMALASELGEKDCTIFFIEWLPYQEREGLLDEADIGIALHPAHIETRYSIRTRVLDYLWARLPVLVTAGDVTSEWVEQYQLGKVVPPLNPQAIASALIELMSIPKKTWEPRFEPIQEQFVWSKVVAPLRAYCMSTSSPPDRVAARGPVVSTSKTVSAQARIARARFILRTEGLGVLLHRAWKYLQWRLSQ